MTLGRRVALVRRGSTLRCFNGHRLCDPGLQYFRHFRCEHQDRQGRSDCPCVLLIMAGGLKAEDGTAMVLVVEVTPFELMTMEHDQMDPEQAAAYLGLNLPNEEAA